MEKEKQEKVRDIDVRIKLLIIIEAGLLSFFTGSNRLIFMAFLSSLLILLWFGRIGTGLKFSVVFLAVSGVNLLVTSLEAQVFSAVLGMLFFLILRMLPVLMLGSWLVGTVKINDFISAMEKMKLPGTVIIPLAVTLRFMPTIHKEFGYIRKTMKMRGISLSAASIIKRPLMTAEYAMVPLLMRSIRVADELSASALTRGIGRNGKRTSYRTVRLSGKDMLWAGVYSFFVAGIFFLEHSGISIPVWR